MEKLWWFQVQLFASGRSKCNNQYCFFLLSRGPIRSTTNWKSSWATTVCGHLNFSPLAYSPPDISTTTPPLPPTTTPDVPTSILYLIALVWSFWNVTFITAGTSQSAEDAYYTTEGIKVSISREGISLNSSTYVLWTSSKVANMHKENTSAILCANM